MTMYKKILRTNKEESKRRYFNDRRNHIENSASLSLDTNEEDCEPDDR